MKNSQKFFENKQCECYPCHKGLDAINCLFCFCPLYEHCIDYDHCRDCTFPHRKENYDGIIERLRKL